MNKIIPDKKHIFNLLEFLRKEVMSSGGDGEALWYTKLYDLNYIFELIKEFNELNSVGWEIRTEEALLSWGIDQEWIIITNNKALFDSQPDWYQIKIQY